MCCIHYYHGHSINKLQNSVLLLVFQIFSKIITTHSERNLIPSTSRKFYYNDVNVTSFIDKNITEQPSYLVLYLLSHLLHRRTEKHTTYYVSTSDMPGTGHLSWEMILDVAVRLTPDHIVQQLKAGHILDNHFKQVFYCAAINKNKTLIYYLHDIIMCYNSQ